MGGHHAKHASPDAGRTPLAAWLLIGPIAVLTLAALIWLWPTEGVDPSQDQPSAEQVEGTVASIEREECVE